MCAEIANDIDGVVQRQSLHVVLAGRIRNMIVEHVIAPGDKVDEKALCVQFGTSRTPLREALKVLASEGLIELMPNRSARVSTISRKQVREMFDVIGWLDREAGRLAAKNATPEGIQRLKQLHEEMRQLYEAKDRVGYFRKNGELHHAIVEMSGNDVLVQLYDELLVHVQRARFVALEMQDHWTRGIKEHGEIIKALSDGDGRAAAKALSNHVGETGKRLADLFSEDGAAQS